MILGGVIFVISGFALERGSPNGACDFEPVYYHARFLVQHQDPYTESRDKYSQLKSGGFLNPKSILYAGAGQIPCVYPPTALLLAAPLAFLTWYPAHLIWMALIALGLLLPSFVVWKVSAQHAPLLSGILIGFFLANSATVLFQANAAGIAVGACVVAVACIFRKRFGFAAIACLTIAFCMKPHDAYLIWVYLILAGGSYRRRALQALLLTCAVAAIAIAWISSVSPNWRQEMAANIAQISSRGGVNDPGPDTATPLIINSAVNLQTVFAVIDDEPVFYNTTTYLLCGVLLIVWTLATIRQPASEERSWLAMAVVSAMTLLPIYHRYHDSKLLLLAVPASAILWMQRRSAGRACVLVTLVALALTGDIPHALLARIGEGHVYSATSTLGKLQMISFERPAPIALLITTCFFLWIYVRAGSQSMGASVSDGSEAIVAQNSV